MAKGMVAANSWPTTAANFLGAFRYSDFKIHISEGHGGLPGMDFFNVKRDPGEKYGELYPGLWVVQPMQQLLGMHYGRVQQFPHRAPMTPEEARLKAQGH